MLTREEVAESVGLRRTEEGGRVKIDLIPKSFYYFYFLLLLGTVEEYPAYVVLAVVNRSFVHSCSLLPQLEPVLPSIPFLLL